MGIRSKIASKRLEKKYSKYVHPKIFDWSWDSKGYDRIALVNYLVSKSGGHECKYLEIGCASNELFDSVCSLQKTGVDPESGGTHRMTSDDFFDKNNYNLLGWKLVDKLQNIIYFSIKINHVNSKINPKIFIIPSIN